MVDRACVNTEDSAGSAKSVVDRACVNTEESAGYAKSVVDRACVDTDSRQRNKYYRECGGFGLCEHGKRLFRWRECHRETLKLANR